MVHRALRARVSLRFASSGPPSGTGGYQFVARDGRVPAGLIYSTVVPAGLPARQDCTNGSL
jgi:hypothetical protein